MGNQKYSQIIKNECVGEQVEQVGILKEISDNKDRQSIQLDKNDRLAEHLQSERLERESTCWTGQ